MGGETKRRSDEELLAEQVAYYRTRAPRYDDWWNRTGVYALDPERKAEWDGEVARLEAAVDDLRPTGSVLELACGTGLWTTRLLRHADHVVALDSSPEALELNRARTGADRVRYVEVDLFEWRPSALFDVVFFSFWLSHVPPSRWTGFWELVRRALAPGGRAIFIDNRWGDGTWRDGPRPDGYERVRNDAGDGQEYRIVKSYYEPDELGAQLKSLGWDALVTSTGRSFVFGWARPPTTRSEAGGR